MQRKAHGKIYSMLHTRLLKTIFALLTATVVAGGGIFIVLHHSFMMSGQQMTHFMSNMSDSCVNSIQCNKVCDVAQSAIAPLAENVLHQVTLVPLSLSLASLSIVFTLLLLAYLEPVLNRPPKLYLAYSVFRI
jgi:hypothetical protein